ncbi:MAG: thiamine pyrophosphate-dependent dehydrogenase E1 component subunit alpha [Oscillospiraceae bacterium]|nr:thiamine pyrophosphate-dependent dehydrogenase E1 component subunit alpha [Oscillospiraceae bacterium]
MEKTDKALLRELCEHMMLARKFEEKVQLLFSQGLVHGTTHLGIGEEATAVGTILATQPQDYLLPTHRGHNQAIAKGVDINAMMAEILAKETGVCKGKGGSMHIADIDKGVLGANGVLGSNGPIACGAAMSIRKKKEDRIVVYFFGDGASNLGAVHEAMNLAAVWDLPVLFVLVNNTYGMSTPISKATRDTDLAKRAIPFAMPSKTVDGNDVLEVYEAVREARDYVAKNGPMLIVENTYRTSGHSKSDGNLYRTKDEIAEWRGKCPIKRLSKYFLDNRIFTQDEIDLMDEKTTGIIEAAVEYGKQSPNPSLDTIMTDVYA